MSEEVTQTSATLREQRGQFFYTLKDIVFSLDKDTFSGLS